MGEESSSVEDSSKKKRKRSKSEKKERKEKKKEKKEKKKKAIQDTDADDADDAVADSNEHHNDDDEIADIVAAEGEESPVAMNEDNDETTTKEEGDNDTTAAAKPKRKRTRKRKKAATADNDDDNNETTTPAEKEAAKKLASLDYTVYVEGIPFDSSDEAVTAFFASHGCPDIIQMRLSRWQDTGRLRGYGHVVFDSTASREKAISSDVNGKHMGQRYLTIQPPKQPKADTLLGSATTPRTQPTGCNVVFVKNLPYHAEEGDVLESFQVCGKIVDGGIRIVRNYQNRQSKGFAYVEYKNPEGAHGSVQKAAKAFGMKVLGRPVFVDYDEGRMRGSFKNENGQLWSKEHAASAKKKMKK